MGGKRVSTRRAVVIAGPTASGKSALALAVAERTGGVIINADSMQVYRDLRILSARPSDADMARASHGLYGHIDAAEAYSVGRWLGEVKTVLENLQADGRLPIVVGGSGLYLQALTQGLSSIPDVPPAVRTRVRSEAEGQTPQHLHAVLARRDPAMAARLRPSDPQRIIRALEVFETTGRSLTTFHAGREPPLLPQDSVVAIRLVPDRHDMRDAIDRRLDAMMATGGLAEVERLAARSLDPALPAMRALGVPPLLAHLRGELTLETAIARSKILTRHYAKRQITFARHQLTGFTQLEPREALDQLLTRMA